MHDEDSQVDYHYKFVLVGDAAVGKTSLRRSYLGKHFEKNHIMTLGADFSLKDVKINTGDILRMQLWDIAGQDLFKSVRSQFLSGTASAIVVFDLTRRETFENIRDWLDQLWQTNNHSDMPLLIIGNKIDLVDERKITSEEANKFVEAIRADENKKTSFIEYIETSAKTGDNVGDAFESLVEGTYVRYHDDEE